MLVAAAEENCEKTTLFERAARRPRASPTPWTLEGRQQVRRRIYDSSMNTGKAVFIRTHFERVRRHAHHQLFTGVNGVIV